MKILIIGGTRFLGRHLVSAALAGGHELTLFNRGNYTTPSGVESIRGDRNHDLDQLQNRRWDAVVDMCGLLPHRVRSSAERLSDSVGIYVFISSQSVYKDLSKPGVDESGELTSLTDDQLEEAARIEARGEASATSYGKLYGGLKALCEQEVDDQLSGRALTIRPGLIVGPHDYTDRFTYWVARVADGGEVLAPAPPGRYIQFIDARDLAEWIVRMIETKATGVYNANGRVREVTMEALLNEVRVTSNSNASFTWADETFLLQEPVAAWSELPLWLPDEAAPHLKGFMFVNSDKAVAAGLRYRSLSTTVSDTLSWYRSERAGSTLAAGIDRDREQTLLRKWHLS